MCEVSKCEFRLPVDVLFILFSWDSSLHSTTSFTNGGREKWRFQGAWSGTGRIMKQKLPVLQRLSYVVYLNSQSIPKWTQIPCFQHLTSHFVLNRHMFDIGRYRQSMGLCFSTLINRGKLLLSPGGFHTSRYPWDNIIQVRGG